MNERKAITDWLRSRRASEPMRLTIERLAELIDQGKHLEGISQKDNETVSLLPEQQVKFNRNYYRRQGRYEERERIIELLEEVAVDEDGCFSERMPETLIALIKGENK